MKTRDWHWWITAFLGIALIPLLRQLNLPIKFDWITLGTAYWIVLAAQAIFVAALFSAIGTPYQETLKPLFDRYRRTPLRMVPLLIFFVLLCWTLTWAKALILTVDAIAILELRERRPFVRSTIAILPPAAYLFAGFLLILAYNSVIVSVRFNFATDPAFWAMDKWLLHGHSVSDFCHWALNTLPISFFHFLEFIYFGMFPQIGATIIFVSLWEGRERGFQFVGTILMAYYLALVLFYVWPSQGPYYLCPDHFLRFPRTLQSYAIQKTLIPHALALWNHVPIERISTDYFIAFPCMHIAQPLVVLWFLRRWKKIAIVLTIYDVLIILAVFLLEMHYVVDVIAGILMAGAAIAITENFLVLHRR